jgi:hypothetical protein
MESLLNRDYALALRNRLSELSNAAWIRVHELDNEDGPLADRASAGLEAMRLADRLERLDAAIELAEELAGESYL